MAQQIIGATDTGWYDSSGRHDDSNDNYVSGNTTNIGATANTFLFRDWFVFDIPSFQTPITSVALRVKTSNIKTLDPFETYQLRDVSTSIDKLIAGGSGLVSIYNDLGGGVIYGDRNFLPSESNQTIDIELNQNFINSLTAANGEAIALGGLITTLDGQDNEELVFGNSGSGSSPDNVQLIVNSEDLSISIIDVSIAEGNQGQTQQALFAVNLSTTSTIAVFS